ncbi:DMT family transporter [Paenibacillus sp. 1P07SE]|uniref:DMT family transporter n=1 Tax=Paenibacillus sp. 1P07SE TaxID=3132209 RepID=UPI0039A69A1C
MSWIALILAGLCEMAGVLMINKYNRHRSWTALAQLILAFALSFVLLAVAMEQLPMGTAYAVWTGIGASGGALLGMLYYGEPRQALRIFFIALVLASAVGLKLLS